MMIWNSPSSPSASLTVKRSICPVALFCGSHVRLGSDRPAYDSTGTDNPPVSILEKVAVNGATPSVHVYVVGQLMPVEYGPSISMSERAMAAAIARKTSKDSTARSDNCGCMVCSRVVWCWRLPVCDAFNYSTAASTVLLYPAVCPAELAAVHRIGCAMHCGSL